MAPRPAQKTPLELSRRQPGIVRHRRHPALAVAREQSVGCYRDPVQHMLTTQHPKEVVFDDLNPLGETGRIS